MKKYLGIDIGGTSAKYAIITEDGKICLKHSFKTGESGSRDAFLETLLGTAEKLIDSNICGIGVCSLGIVDTNTGVILGGVQNLPYLEGLSFKQVFREKYPQIPVSVLNDVKSVALGEQWLGAAKGCKNFVCIALGTGLGGAIVIDGKLVEGAHFRAGEVCYLDYKNDDNYLEKRVSTKYVMDYAAEKLGADMMDGFEFFRLVREKNDISIEILEEWVYNISRFVANIIITLDLEKVILGGGISNEKDILIPLITEKVNDMLPEEFRNQASIEAALCANDAGMLGAVSLFMK